MYVRPKINCRIQEHENPGPESGSKNRAVK